MLAKTLRLMIAAACIDNAEGQLAKRWKEKFKCFESKTAGSIKFEGLQLAGWEFRAGTGQLENPKLEEIHSFLSPLQNTLCKTNDMPDILTATSFHVCCFTKTIQHPRFRPRILFRRNKFLCSFVFSTAQVYMFHKAWIATRTHAKCAARNNALFSGSSFWSGCDHPFHHQRAKAQGVRKQEVGVANFLGGQEFLFRKFKALSTALAASIYLSICKLENEAILRDFLSF